MLLLLLLGMSLIRRAVWVSETLLPSLYNASTVAFGVCLFILLPLCIFRKTLGFAGACCLGTAPHLVLSSYVPLPDRGRYLDMAA